jgi:hypothetical protein
MERVVIVMPVEINIVENGKQMIGVVMLFTYITTEELLKEPSKMMNEMAQVIF